MVTLRILKNRPLLPVFLVSIIGMTCGAMTGAIQVLFALDLNSTLTDISLMSLFGGLSGLILLIPLGMLSDKIGRKPTMLLTESLALASDITRIMASEPWHLIIAQLFSGRTFIPAIMGLIIDATDSDERAEAVSTIYFFFGIGMLAGPSIANLLLLSLPIRSLYYVDFAARLGLMGLILFGIKETKRSESPTTARSGFGNAMLLLRRRNMLLAIGSGLSIFFTLATLQIYLPVLARQELQLSDALVVSLSTFRAAGLLMFRTVMGKILSKVTVKQLLLVMLSILVLGGLILPFSESFVIMSLIMVMYGVSWGAIPPICGILSANAATKADRSTAHSIYQLSSYVRMINPTLLNPIAVGLGLIYVFPAGVLLPFTVAVISFFVMKPIKPTRND